MIVYQYNEITKEFIGRGVAQKNPLPMNDSDQYLLPANATFKQPPEVSQNEKQIFLDGEWKIIPDHRGTYYHYNTLQNIEITELGVLPPNEYTKNKPNPEYQQFQIFLDNKWKFDIEKYRNYSLYILNKKTTSIILSKYPFHKQLNITNDIEDGKIEMIEFIKLRKQIHSRTEVALNRTNNRESIDKILAEYK